MIGPSHTVKVICKLVACESNGKKKLKIKAWTLSSKSSTTVSSWSSQEDGQRLPILSFFCLRTLVYNQASLLWFYPIYCNEQYTIKKKLSRVERRAGTMFKQYTIIYCTTMWQIAYTYFHIWSRHTKRGGVLRIQLAHHLFQVFLSHTLPHMLDPC